MKKNIYFFSIIISSILSTTSSAQSLIPFKVDSTWGFCSEKLDVVIKPQYKLALPFIDNYAIVTLPSTNTLVLERTQNTLVYDMSYVPFESQKYGLIDKQNKVVLPFVYDDIKIKDQYYVAYKFKDSYQVFSSAEGVGYSYNPSIDTVIIFDTNLNELLKFDNPNATYLGNGIFSTMTYNKDIPTTTIYKDGAILKILKEGIELYPYHEKLAPGINYLSRERVYVDTLGNVVYVATDKNYLGFYKDGIALISDQSNYYLLNKKFKIKGTYSKQLTTNKKATELFHVFEKHLETLDYFHIDEVVTYKNMRVFPRISNGRIAASKLFKQNEEFIYGTISIDDPDTFSFETISIYPNECEKISYGFYNDYIHNYKNNLIFVCNEGDVKKGFVSYFMDKTGFKYLLSND